MNIILTGKDLVSISKVAIQYGTSADKVYAVLQQRGVEPAMIVPHSRGFMRQYRKVDLDTLTNVAKDIETLRAVGYAARDAGLARGQKKATAPAARAKAGKTNHENAVERKLKELKKYKKIFALMKDIDA